MTVRILAAWALGFCLFVSAPVGAATCSDPSTGYQFTVPDDWTAIPSDVLASLTQKAKGPNSPAYSFVAAYQPSSNKTYFEYPYLLVQITPYPNNQSIDSISESDLKTLAASMNGVNMDDLRKTTSTEVATLFVGSDLPMQASYFTDPPGYRITMSMKTTLGDVRGMIQGDVGKDHLVSVNLYSKAADWDKSLPVFQQIAGSFHLTPDQQAPLKGGVLTTGIITGAVIGGFGGLIGVLIGKFKKKQSPA